MTDPDSRYYTPCPSGRPSLEGDSVIHVHVVSALTLTTIGMPPGVLDGNHARGLVFENTPSGREPVVGALVDVNYASEPTWRRSTTLTDHEGRFRVCRAVPLMGGTFVVRARKDGYREGTAEAFVDWDLDSDPVDIELVRQ